MSVADGEPSSFITFIIAWWTVVSWLGVGGGAENAVLDLIRNRFDLIDFDMQSTLGQFLVLYKRSRKTANRMRIIYRLTPIAFQNEPSTASTRMSSTNDGMDCWLAYLCYGVTACMYIRCCGFSIVHSTRMSTYWRVVRRRPSMVGTYLVVD